MNIQKKIDELIKRCTKAQLEALDCNIQIDKIIDDIREMQTEINKKEN